MASKYNYEYVKCFISKKSNGECELVSKEYVNSTSPLTLKCKCGNIFYSTFAKLRNSEMQCKSCRDRKASERYRLDINYVKEYIKSKGCEYISGEYINNSSLLKIKCKCGNVFTKKFCNFKRGQSRCPNCGKESSRQSKFKYRREDAEKILAEKNLKLIGDYIDSFHSIDCVCDKGHKFSTKLQFVLYKNFGCTECSKQYRVGENANHYLGGESEVLDRFRKILKQWKVDVAKKYNYVCALTGAKYDCVVHHLTPFMDIVRNCCKELNIPLYRKLKDYDIEKFKELESLILRKHTPEIGILLQRKVHNKFHSIYGKKNNTLEQFNEFVKGYYPNIIPTNYRSNIGD